MTPSHYDPVDSGVTPRFGGHATFMRLPVVTDPHEVDVAIAGVPWDTGTTNRPGPRHGPRQVREMSSLIKRVHAVTVLILATVQQDARCGSFARLDCTNIT